MQNYCPGPPSAPPDRRALLRQGGHPDEAASPTAAPLLHLAQVVMMKYRSLNFLPLNVVRGFTEVSNNCLWHHHCPKALGIFFVRLQIKAFGQLLHPPFLRSE